MSKVIKEVHYGEHKLVIETGEIARQADGAVVVSMNGTSVLVTAVIRKELKPGQGFFPLTVNYQEKYYSAGKIPGGFLKREGRPSDHETLTCRLIDRPIRPLFPKEFLNEVQVIANVISYNPDVSPDILALIGASAALAISGAPFKGPIGAARVGYKDGIYMLNPSIKELEDSSLDLVVAGTKKAILMVESEASELSEKIMLGAVLFGHEAMQSVIASIVELVEEVNHAPMDWDEATVDQDLVSRVAELAADTISKAYLIRDKQERYQSLKEMRTGVITQLVEEQELWTEDLIKDVIASLEKKTVRATVLRGEERIDGRDVRTVRPISVRTSVLERTHGSALFTRGETQALVVATLGNEKDAQFVDSLSGNGRDRFMLHYNFPPSCVGETGMVGSPKRREIGHGRLARRGIAAVLPTIENFPYTLRVVSEITESNGSSSMASVCGTSLALMDAGVPLKAPVAGIAMGLIKEGEEFAVLTDILGDEDHLGDMDFKVAGTAEGVTALQMDIKIDGITREIMQEALDQAHEGRMHILGVMNNSLDKSRETMSEYAPRVETIQINKDKIRDVIGKGGVTIKKITETTGVDLDISDDGLITLFSSSLEGLEAARAQIKEVTAEVEIGETYHGKVSKIVDFSAFINLLPGRDGLLHISRICDNREQVVSEKLKEGEFIDVLVEDIDRQGRVKLQWTNKPKAPQATTKEADDTTENAVSSD